MSVHVKQNNLKPTPPTTKVQTWQLICTTLLGTVQQKSKGGTLIKAKKKKGGPQPLCTMQLH